MKNISVLIFLLGFINAMAVEVEVSDMEVSAELEGRFDLETNHPQKVVLDCQSFIQGLFFGERGGEQVIMLEESECQQLVEDMHEGIGQYQRHCLEVDFDSSILQSQGRCK
jgi:hypothetical protein